MTLTVQPVREEDLDRLVEIEFAAWAHSPPAQFLRARDSSNPAHVKRLRAQHQHMLLSRPTMSVARVVDDADGQTIAWMRWEDLPHGIDHSRPLDHEFTAWPFDLASEEQLKMVKAYYAVFERERREIMGTEPHCHLTILVVDPQYQRRGAGKALVSHFVQEADRRRVVGYVDSSEQAKGLYAQFGFVPRKESVFEATAPGMSGTRAHVVMIRPVQQ